VLLKPDLVDSFTEWAECVEPRLRHALTASFGSQAGAEAAADALAFAWEHWDEVRVKADPLAFVYGVGRNKARRGARRRPVFLPVAVQRLPHVEPQLAAAIARLPERQRVVITLVYGYEWTHDENVHGSRSREQQISAHPAHSVRTGFRHLSPES
jgi:DNA-directed RNA polymerase specialized sigma24 family protein